jgi:hypothetical protein
VRCLTLEGLWIGLNPDGIPDEVLANPDDACTPVEAVLAIEGEFDRVLIRHCTLDPGGERARLVAGTCTPVASVVLEIRGQVKELVIESSIVGAIREVTDDADPCSVGRIVIRDSVVQSLLPDTPAIGTRVGAVELERVTVFGGVTVNRLDASESLIQGLVLVLDSQHGCFRFSATDPPNRRLPRQFESPLLRPGPNHFFASRRFGDAAFAQLSKNRSGHGPDRRGERIGNRRLQRPFESYQEPRPRTKGHRVHAVWSHPAVHFRNLNRPRNPHGHP